MFEDVDFDLLHDKSYRLNNLYRIIDRDGNDVIFKLNSVQSDVLEKQHNRNVILKARQLGMSTYCVLDLLDDCLWTPTFSGGIVSYSLEHAQHIFKRILGHAIDHLPKWLNPNIKSRSAREMNFGNGSVLRVDTTLRGGAYQSVLVSEFGKTCARNPIKAEEVVTGTLQAVSRNSKVTIESTGEGSDGYFAEIVTNSAQRGNENLTPLDYKLFFYSWLDEEAYRVKQYVSADTEMIDYFAKVEKKTGLTISKDQRSWYVTQSKVLGDKIQQEYPSTVEEAFLSTSEAYYFAHEIKKAWDENRCLYTSLYDPLLPVHVAMDIGVNDLTVMTFFQLVHGERRILDYYEDSNKGVDFYAKFLLKDKPYHYDTIFLPHDSKKRSQLDENDTYERDFRRLFSGTNTKFVVLKRMEKQIAISHTKIKLGSFVFNVAKVKKFLDKCSKYRKKWSEPLGRYLPEPLHDIHSNYGDCLQYTSQAMSQLESSYSLKGALQKHREVVSSRRFKI